MKENFEKSYLERIAKAAHEINRTWCGIVDDGMQNVPWEETKENYREGIMEGVAFVLSTPNIKESDSHENWLSAKKADGWVYGPVKDEEKKEHPCMVPYSELPAAQRGKDKLFIATVLAMRAIPISEEVQEELPEAPATENGASTEPKKQDTEPATPDKIASELEKQGASDKATEPPVTAPPATAPPATENSATTEPEKLDTAPAATEQTATSPETPATEPPTVPTTAPELENGTAAPVTEPLPTAPPAAPEQTATSPGTPAASDQATAPPANEAAKTTSTKKTGSTTKGK